MASLLVGCKTVLYMINRLDAYLAFWHSLPDSVPPKPPLKDTMVGMYACVLGFLAQAIETYPKSGIKRALSSLWQESDVQDFESRCKDHADRVEQLAAACDRVLREKDSKTIVQSYQDLQRVLQELQQIRSVQVVVDRIERKIDLQGLKIVREALFDSHAQKHTACHPSTREALLQQIRDWARGPDSKSIFWLQGMAGTGKSTISCTIADWLCSQAPKDDVQLGATFFFERGENDRASAHFLFPTIVHQLAQKIPGLDILVAEAVGHNPDISSKNPAEQFKVLIRQPLQQLAPILDRPIHVIVIDALDECKTDEIVQMQRLLSEIPTFQNVRLRLFLTSRPEIPIQQSFRGLLPDAHQVVVLHEVPRAIIHHDILVYLRAAFTTIRTDFNSLPLLDEPLPENWPGNDILRDLTDMAVPLFIVAATIHRFVYDFGPLQPDPQERLAVVLQSRKLGHLSSLMQIYLPVLGYLTPPPAGETDLAYNKELYGEFKTIIGSIVTLAEPLSRNALAQLLNLPSKIIARHMRPLYSVLQIPSAADDPVRILHLSFAEFLTNTNISDRPFAVNSKVTHSMLFNKCIELLSRSGSRGLRENICHLKFPGQSRHDLSPAQVDEHLPPEMQYACRYWVHHAQQSQHVIRDNGIIHTFFRQHFLHWLEALSLMSCLAIAIKDIGKLQLLVTGSACNEVTDSKPIDSNLYREGSTHIKDLLEDARRFILTNRYVCEQAPLQLYSSSLIFAPWKSIVREECSKMPGWVERTPKFSSDSLNWGPEIQVLEGHNGGLWDATLSPDGTLLASASDDESVRLWDMSTGQEVQKLEGHKSSVSAVVFASMDGSILASSSWDSTVRLWDIKSGNEVQKPKRFDGRQVSPVVCSPDKALLACSYGEQPSNGDMILVWKTATGQEMHKLEENDVSAHVRCLAFSSDGAVLASASETVVSLWSLSTGQCTRKLDIGDDVWAVAFSPNTNVLALGTKLVIRLWDTAAGQELRKLEGHTGRVLSVAFSPLDSSRLVSASDDNTVRIWDINSDQEIQTLRGHTRYVPAASFSPNGTMIVSASQDYTIRLWKATSDKETQHLSDGGPAIERSVFSHNATLLAAADKDFVIRLFDVSTGDVVQVLKGHARKISDLAFSHDDALLATASSDFSVLLWKTDTGQQAQKLEGHTDEVENVRFLQDGISLASVSWDETVRIWSIITGQEIRRFHGYGCDMRSMTSSSDDALLITGSGDHSWVWNMSTGQEVQHFEMAGMAGARAISFGKTLTALAISDGTVHLRDVGTGHTMQILEGHEKEVTALAFDFDDVLLASASYWSGDNTIKLWNVSTGQEVQKLQCDVVVKKLRFAPDKSISITEYGNIRGNIWTGLKDTDNEKTSSYPGVDGDIFVNAHWIQHRGRNLLWLPPDYRQSIAVRGNIVATGRTDGRICILKINYP